MPTFTYDDKIAKLLGVKFTLDEVAKICGVKRRTVYAWLREGQFSVVLRRTGRFSVQVLVTADELLRLVNKKFGVPGDGSPAAQIWEERVRRRRIAGLAASAKRSGKLRKQNLTS